MTGWLLRDLLEMAKRIIFSTGDISSESKEYFHHNDILYIRKPFKITDYLTKIGEGMKRRKFEKSSEIVFS